MAPAENPRQLAASPALAHDADGQRGGAIADCCAIAEFPFFE
jgi:hypothetical protein